LIELQRKRLTIPTCWSKGFLLNCGDDGNGEVSGRKRRSSEEVKRLVTEFESSVLGQNEFCPESGFGAEHLAAKYINRTLSAIRKSPEDLLRVESEPLRLRICDSLNCLTLLAAMLKKLNPTIPIDEWARLCSLAEHHNTN
jgi:hypothetical protein